MQGLCREIPEGRDGRREVFDFLADRFARNSGIRGQRSHLVDPMAVSLDVSNPKQANDVRMAPVREIGR